MVPDGIFLDVDGLAEVDLGNGTNYNPAEALNMYFQTGSVIGRSLTQDGDMNRGKVPIQELASSSGISKIQSLFTMMLDAFVVLFFIAIPILIKCHSIRIIYESALTKTIIRGMI